MTPSVEDALALARAIGRDDREAVDVLLDDFGITSSEKAAALVGYLCGLLIGLAQLHAARTGESWEDLLTQLVNIAPSASNEKFRPERDPAASAPAPLGASRQP